jgi:hypothetical protein
MVAGNWSVLAGMALALCLGMGCSGFLDDGMMLVSCVSVNTAFHGLAAHLRAAMRHTVTERLLP